MGSERDSPEPTGQVDVQVRALPGSVEPGIGGYFGIVDKLSVGVFTLNTGCVGSLDFVY